MEKFFLVTVYTPNSQDGLKRLDYRMTWDDDFRAYLQKLDQSKPVLVCGDLNVAHKEIDLKNPKTNRMNAGFTDQEREKFQLLLDAGFIDTFRYFYPEQTNPLLLSRANQHLFLVVLPFQGTREECRVAY